MPAMRAVRQGERALNIQYSIENIQSLLTFDDTGQHHLMLGTDGFGVLISRAGKSHHVPADFGHFSNFIHQTMLSAINRSGVIVIFLDQFVHVFDHRLKRSAGIFFFD
jgi:hypothetical protein